MLDLLIFDASSLAGRLAVGQPRRQSGGLVAGGGLHQQLCRLLHLPDQSAGQQSPPPAPGPAVRQSGAGSGHLGHALHRHAGHGTAPCRQLQPAMDRPVHPAGPSGGVAGNVVAARPPPHECPAGRQRLPGGPGDCHHALQRDCRHGPARAPAVRRPPVSAVAADRAGVFRSRVCAAPPPAPPGTTHAGALVLRPPQPC